MKTFMILVASLIAMSCSPTSAQNSSAADMAAHTQIAQGRLYVSGTGQAVQAPDQASVSAGVVTRAPSAGEAMRANAVKMNQVFKALKAAGLKEQDIMTSQMSLQPQYDYQDRRAPRISGYEARNTVTARSNDLDKTGPMIDALVAAGVNTINGVHFSIKDARSARDKARVQAITRAQDKAEQMAKAAGVKLGKLLEIREGDGAQPPRPMLMARAMAESVESTPIAGGEQTLSVSVNLVFAIGD